MNIGHRKMLSIAVLLTMIHILFYSSSVQAAQDKDFSYSIFNGKAEVIQYIGRQAVVNVPDTLGGYPVAYIDMCAFDYRTNIVSIIIPKSITKIDGFAFRSCPSLTNITVDADNTNYSSANGLLFNKAMTKLISCPNGLTSVTIPKGVTCIGENAFLDCKALTNITIPQGVTTLEHGAFQSCTSLTTITLPPGITSIGDAAFADCKSLTKVTFGRGLISINRYAFSGCTNLISITFLQGLNSIGDNAFYGCQSLKNVNLPEGLTNIGPFAFMSCSELSNIIIPKSVVAIKNTAFYGCNALQSITFNSATTNIYDYKDTIPETTKIIGFASSTAKTYAAKYHRTFEVIGGSQVATQLTVPKVILDGKVLSFDVNPTIDCGRVMVPLRAIFEAMGAKVDWDPTTMTATAVKGKTTVVIKIGSLTPTINGTVKTIDVPAEIVNNRTLAPLRFVCEAFEGHVDWEPDTGTANIKSATVYK